MSPPAELTEWLLFIAAIGAATTALYVIWNRWVLPVIHAADRAMDDLHRIRVLLEANVVERLEDGDAKFDCIEKKVDELIEAVASLRALVERFHGQDVTEGL